MTTTSRRQALKALAVAGCSALGVGLYIWRVEPHWLQITRRELAIRGLARGLEDCRLAQISDMHVGPQVDDSYVVETFQRVSTLRPDYVAYTGDGISYRGPQQFVQLRRVLENAPRGRLGTVGFSAITIMGSIGGCSTSRKKLLASRAMQV